MQRIIVSPDKHHLSTSTGEPFFWLADTAWELFHRLTRPEIEHYLENRRQKGFNVIQAVALAEFDGLRVPNCEGHVPFIDFDPAKPDNAYFAILDYTIRLAAEKNLYIALLPTWGDKVARIWGEGPEVFTVENAHTYGRWLGARYKADSNVIWVIGGDRPAVTAEADYRPVWRAMAAGIDAGCGFRPFKTYHPNGGGSTSQWLQDEDWLDMHMVQSGHGGGRDTDAAWKPVAHDYRLHPPRPTLDGEPNYEDHPVNPWPEYDPADGYYRAYDVRKQSYRSVFSGGCGVTYGNHAIWQMAGGGYGLFNFAERSWQDSLDRPGAVQIHHLKDLVLARPYFTRIPAQDLLLSGPGAGPTYTAATRDTHGRFALVYFPNPAQSVELDLSPLVAHLSAAWFDPRTGASTPLRTITDQQTASFTSPATGPDWVLTLDAVG